jgi:hypothetical protein
MEPSIAAAEYQVVDPNFMRQKELVMSSMFKVRKLKGFLIY